MADCCCAAPAETGNHAVGGPSCGASGAGVDLRTVKALLTERALARLRPTEHRFCSDPVCGTVYFTAEGDCYQRDELRVPVWQKEAFGARLICYCFGETESRIRDEIETSGRSRALERVREHIAAGRCACEIRNPRGACCLGDLSAAVRRVEVSLQAETPASVPGTPSAPEGAR